MTRPPTHPDPAATDWVYRYALAAYTALLDGGHLPPSPPAVDMHPLARALRRAWWRAGGQGHYPTCPCGTCHRNRRPD